MISSCVCEDMDHQWDVDVSSAASCGLIRPGQEELLPGCCCALYLLLLQGDLLLTGFQRFSGFQSLATGATDANAAKGQKPADPHD